MQQIILDEKIALAFEPLEKNIRLIVLQANEELVCRKETLQKLNRFLSADKAHLFRGRLQLEKKNDLIEVLVKQKSVGIISSGKFKEVLEMIGD